MKNSKPLLQALRSGQKVFCRADYPTPEAFEAILSEMKSLDEFGFVNGYKIYRDKLNNDTIISVSASHGLSDEGTDYLIRIGG
nr:hypothetical protein [uncultured Undibacterium sp.]